MVVVLLMLAVLTNQNTTLKLEINFGSMVGYVRHCAMANQISLLSFSLRPIRLNREYEVNKVNDH